jgi:hypothetical protein
MEASVVRVRSRARRHAGRSLVAVAALQLAAPAASRAADVTATPSTFSSVFAAAKAGDRVLLASGDYGTFSGGTKSGTVTVTPQAGASVSMALSFNGASGIRVDGLSIDWLIFQGTTKNVTVANSSFTGSATVRAEQLSNSNIVFDHNTHAGIDVCSTCYEGRLQIAGQAPGPSGVTIENSTFGPGGDADGIQIGANGVQVLDNEFVGIHQISAVHTDSLQLYGQRNTVIRGNYFHDFDTAIMAPDGGSNEQITDNVFINTSSYRPAIQMGGFSNSLFAHNVIKGLDAFMDAKSGNPPGTNNVLRDNVVVSGTLNAPETKCSNCTISYNLFTSSPSGTNAITGTPVFAGGSNPSSYAGYALAAGSPGKANASDGTDRGIRTDADPVPTPTPTPTSTPTRTPTPTPTAIPTPTSTAAPGDARATAVWAAPSNATAGVPVVLDGRASTGDGALSCTWSFEDQTGLIVWETASGCRVTKTFANSDTKYVRLSVRDADGDTDSNRQSFTVKPKSTPTPTPTPIVPVPLPVPTPSPPTLLDAPGPVAQVASTTRRGPVAAYGFNEKAGKVAADASGEAHDATLRGARHTTVAKAGRALAFDGRRSLVRVPAPAADGLRSGMTLEAWVRPATKASTWQTVLQRGHGDAVAFALFASDARGRSAARAGTVKLHGAPLPRRRWTHLALTYDGAVLRVYSNGRLVRSGAAPAPVESGALTIGGGDAGRFFKGQIDDVRVYRRPLSAQEIQSDLRSPA